MTTEASGGYSERGLLGLAISPSFATDHYVYTFHSARNRTTQEVVRWTDCAGVGRNPEEALRILKALRTAAVALLALYRGSVRDRVMGWRSTATSVGGLVWPLLGGVLGGRCGGGIVRRRCGGSLLLLDPPIGLLERDRVPLRIEADRRGRQGRPRKGDCSCRRGSRRDR